MLEARKLSSEVQQNKSADLWSWLSGLLWLSSLLVLSSIWIGANFEAPPPDRSQEEMNASHAQVISTIENLHAWMAPEQELSSELWGQLAESNSALIAFRQKAADALKMPLNSDEPLNWPGKINAMLEDIKVLNDGKNSLEGYFQLRDSLLALYKPIASVHLKQMPEGSSANALYRAILDWSNVSISQLAKPSVSPSPAMASALAADTVPKLTWDTLSKGQPIWREINSQLETLEMDAKQNDDLARAKLAKEIMTALAKNDVMQSVRQSDDAWSKVLAAQDRLRTASSQSLPVPQLILAPVPWSWSTLSFPGTTEQGILLAMSMILLGLLVSLSGNRIRKNHMRTLSKRWLKMSQELEAVVRSVDAPLVDAVQTISTLSFELGLISEKLKEMQDFIMTPAESHQKNLEEQSWDAALRLQSEVEADLNLLREKLFNIHLHFCSGQTHENLVYDLAFTTEAVQTVFNTAKDLGRSVALLKDNSQPIETGSDRQELESLIGQVNELRQTTKRIALGLKGLSSRLQVAVEDVPKGKRFEVELRNDESKRS